MEPGSGGCERAGGLGRAGREDTMPPVRKPIDRPERARQLARAIASDLSLYNEEKIIAGIKDDNLFEVMAEEIRRGGISSRAG